MSTTAGPIVPVITGISTVLSPTVMVAVVWVISVSLRLSRNFVPQYRYRSAAALTSQTKGAAKPSGLLRVLIAERLGVFVVGEQFAVAAEVDHRAQRPIGVVLGHVV